MFNTDLTPAFLLLKPCCRIGIDKNAALSQPAGKVGKCSGPFCCFFLLANMFLLNICKLWDGQTAGGKIVSAN